MNLPEYFIVNTKSLLKQDWDKLSDALDSEVPVSIRKHPIKRENLKDISLPKVPWCHTGHYLPERPRFTFDPLFHAGCYYVQEASSMFIGQAIKQLVKGDVKVLDLCAAPGGKSTLIAEMLSKDSLLVSNEVIRSRANILSENIMKWGYSNVIVTNNDPADIGKIRSFFDVILIDAPCSGEGMFRKDAGAVDEWSVGNVKLCKERQQRILADIWPALKPGGLLLYSTCTYNLEENENNAQWIMHELGADALSINVEEEWGISPSFADNIPAYRFFPHKTKGEGFFFAALTKNVQEAKQGDFRKKKNDESKTNKIKLSEEYKNYIVDEDQFTFFSENDTWYAFPSILYGDLLALKSYLNIISKGICIGEFKGKYFIPSQSLVLSNNFNKKAFNVYEADWQTAISYLRKEMLVLPDQPKGYILLTYQHIPLGFVKNIGNRANNLYPQEWRIRSSNIPAEETGLF